MLTEIKRRLYNLKKRVYLEAKYLEDYGFGIGQPIRFAVDHKNGVIIVEPVAESKKHVAKTTQKTGKVVPVIDIKASEVSEFFAKHERIYVEIIKGKIIFTVAEVKEQVVQNDNVISLEDIREKKLSLKRYAVSVDEYAKVANYEQMTIFDVFESQNYEWKTHTTRQNAKDKAIKMLSLFSGCGTMDKAFLDQGYDIVFANDRFEGKALRDYHIQTYRSMIGDHIVMKDVMDLREEDIPYADFLCAGIPCVTFSKLNTSDKSYRKSQFDLHPIVEKTLDILRWSKAKSFLFENVPDFIEVKGGRMLDRIKERLPGFGITAKVIDSSTMGSAQKRKRVFIFGIKDAEPSIDLPLVHEVRTVKDAFRGVEEAPQQEIYFAPTDKILERMKHVPQGGNILDVPVELRSAKKKFTDYCIRLAENQHAPTVAHVQDHVIFHPTEERYISVREAARLFSLPDEFTFTGSRTAIFEMLKNAVDYRVTSFLAKMIKQQLNAVFHPTVQLT